VGSSVSQIQRQTIHPILQLVSVRSTESLVRLSQELQLKKKIHCAIVLTLFLHWHHADNQVEVYASFLILALEVLQFVADSSEETLLPGFFSFGSLFDEEAFEFLFGLAHRKRLHTVQKKNQIWSAHRETLTELL
jgi:hypothetical protein